MTERTTTMVITSAALGAAAALALRKLVAGSLAAMTPAHSPTRSTMHFTKSMEITAAAPLVHGTILLCTQNLAVSGANQVLLNLVEGGLWKGNVVLLSPSSGPFAKEFAELGVAVRIGELRTLLRQVRDVRMAVCNTIMTAHNVVALDAAGIPSMWVLHEWWPGQMLVDELTKRNDKNTTPEIVSQALKRCKRTVCVCKNQLNLYQPEHGQAVFVGVPDPAVGWKLGALPPEKRPITFLTLGIVCPRKNQHWAVETFLRWAGDRTDVRLLVVGARYIRKYESDYVEKVKQTIAGDKRVELHDVTSNVDEYYRQSDVLLFTSLNEVTPMVIAESMLRAIPVITTDIAGIPEMLVHGTHGFVLPPDEHKPFVDALNVVGAPGADGQRRRLQMGAAARKHAIETFTNAIMVAQYRAAALTLSPPIVLVDMDGVLVDWDRGFESAWKGRTPIIRSLSYAMEECVPPSHKAEACSIFHAEGFFRDAPPMAGGVKALHALAAAGYRVLLCTSPVTTSAHCAGEKVEWVRAHLGPSWVPKMIITSDKTAVRGDVLIDDKPKITGAHRPTWQQLLFTAPYNVKCTPRARLSAWEDIDTVMRTIDGLLCSGPQPAPAAAASAAAPAEGEGGALGELAAMRSAVAALPDFSHLLPPDYRKDYAAWRSGRPKGAAGELGDAIARMEAMQDSVLNNMSEEFTEVSVFRTGYAAWRKGRAGGAKSSSTASQM